MTARKTWAELSPRTRANRFELMAAEHLPKQKHVVSQMVRHSHCRDGGACTGPGCRIGRGR